MPIVEDLFIYPVKSARGVRKSSVRVAATGFEWDRHWMAVDTAGTFLTQRTHPRLALVEPEITSDALELHAPGLPTLRVPLEPTGMEVSARVWDHPCTALDQGVNAGQWLSEAVGHSVRLVRVAPSMGRVANPKYAGPNPVPVAFPDGFPILVCNQASLADLNARMPEQIPMERFRPNVVLGGLPAFAEDRIDSLQLGEVTLRLVKPCTRCVIPSTDQRTGERSTDPLPVLRTFRFDRTLLGVTFGENAIVVSGAGSSIERGCEGIVSFET
jgi:uncharacterized protein YcbX